MSSKNKIFGEFFKQKRLEKNISLRQFCVKNSFDSGNISKLERGLIAPPGDDFLNKYAEALNIKKGSDDWYEFFDKAATRRGHIPADIMKNENIVKNLPIFFRTARGEKLTKKDLEKLVEIIKGN